MTLMYKRRDYVGMIRMAGSSSAMKKLVDDLASPRALIIHCLEKYAMNDEVMRGPTFASAFHMFSLRDGDRAMLRTILSFI